MKTTIFVLIIFLLGACSSVIVEEYINPDSGIQIFLVKENQLEVHSSDINLISLELEQDPWVKDSDIEFYDWSAHSFYLNKEIEKGPYSGRHFVVTSGEKRLFAGVFFPMVLSSIPSIPSISPEDGFFSPKDVVRFGYFGFHFPGNLNEDIKFRSELTSAGLLREGITVEIIALKKANPGTLNYTYEVTNLDTENIYILDPQKMGDSRFHYYTNGVSLMKDDNNYWPQNFESTPSDEIEFDWYYKLRPGKSMSRKVSINGFETLPSGKVTATFRFPGANLKSTGEWKKPDGRIWLGNFVAEQELTLR